MSLIPVVRLGLVASGHDGLYQAGICGCKANDLSPGNCMNEDCEPGYLHKHSTKDLWIIHQQKEPVGDAVIEEISDY